METYRIGFIFSYVLGHVLHHKTLQAHVEADPSVTPTWMLIKDREGDWSDRVPPLRNHMPLRMSLRARRRIKSALREGPLDVLFYHTQITGMLASRHASRIPTVLSMDATPIDFARLGAYHAQSKPRTPPYRGLTYRVNRMVFRRATAIVAWSQWCKRSLVADYDVDPARVAVIPAGVDLSRWKPAPKLPADGRKARLLFVGGDFKRKGGEALLAAFAAGLSDVCELDIVSGDVDGPVPAGVRNHGVLEYGGAAMRQLYDQADVFVFPSRAECMPLATMDAMASGLPIITTAVGGLPEQVENGDNGLIVPPEDPAALAAAVRALAAEPERRLAMGRAGRERAERLFDAGKNYPALIALLKQCADTGRNAAPGSAPSS